VPLESHETNAASWARKASSGVGHYPHGNMQESLLGQSASSMVSWNSCCFLHRLHLCKALGWMISRQSWANERSQANQIVVLWGTSCAGPSHQMPAEPSEEAQLGAHH